MRRCTLDRNIGEGTSCICQSSDHCILPGVMSILLERTHRHTFKIDCCVVYYCIRFCAIPSRRSRHVHRSVSHFCQTADFTSPTSDFNRLLPHHSQQPSYQITTQQPPLLTQSTMNEEAARQLVTAAPLEKRRDLIEFCKSVWPDCPPFDDLLLDGDQPIEVRHPDIVMEMGINGDSLVSILLHCFLLFLRRF